MKNPDKPQLGLSGCLAGQAVRFDGGHKRNRFITDECAEYFDLHPLCPELELGLGVPRPAIQLRKTAGEVRLVYSKDPQHDLTDSMRDFAHDRISSLPPLDGFILKKDSPTCGLIKVPVLDDATGQRVRNGTGVFADIFQGLYPEVPLEEEGRLNDIRIRENFLERVFAHFRWRQIALPDENLPGFINFHKNYKLVLMAKNAKEYQKLGRFVAETDRHNLAQRRRQYFRAFTQLMTRIPSRGQHINVLMHILGYLRTKLDAEDKAELLDWFESYRNQRVNRITPLALLQHHFRRHPSDYLAEQYYFSPFPAELIQPV